MILNKWDYKENKYKSYEVPYTWNCKTYSEDMNEKVNCAHCGKVKKYGDCYTSLEIQTSHGFGYAVCEKCYFEEWQKRKKFRDE